MPFTAAYKSKLLTNIFSGNHLGLGRSAEGGEPTIDPNANGSGYTRYAVAGSDFAVTGGTTITNTKKIRFDEALDSSWGTIRYLQVHDASSGGHQTFYIPLTNPTEIRVDEMPKFDPNQISVSINES